MSDGLDDAADTAAEHVAASAADPSVRKAKARPSRTAVLRPDNDATHCANCNTELQGPVCHHCGQLADEFHRPVRGLVGEIIEGLFALDGRVARTIPNLLLRPGRITRAYLKGQRARFMPPFRLYIIASLIFFLLVPAITNGFDPNEAQQVGDAIANGVDVEGELAEAEASGDLSAEQVAETRAALEAAGLGRLLGQDEEEGDPQAGPPGDTSTDDTSTDGAEAAPADTSDDAPRMQVGVERGPGDGAVFGIGNEESGDQIRRFMVPEDFGGEVPENAWPYSVRSFLADRFARVAEDPQAWLDEAASWTPRVMFVMVPVYALLLSLCYAWRRGFFLYDHLIVSVHFHAALFLALTVFYLIGHVVPGGLVFLAVLIYSNAYLYRLHRVVYERGRFSSILRTLALDTVYGIVLSLGLTAALLLSALVG